MDRMVALFTRDLRYRDVAMGVTNRTAAELCAFGESLFASFPDATFELCSSVANGYRDTAEWIMRGTHKGDVPGAPATGKAVEISGASVFEFERDRIRGCSDYWDMARFLKDLACRRRAPSPRVRAKPSWLPRTWTSRPAIFSSRTPRAARGP
ncbi:ester cyclase [Allosphingosinicella sp.]|uniref:ester cyclase n=1 Tax=Allosphingosinicella sp. TaxID=2823234 RepID=UPI002FC12D10